MQPLPNVTPVSEESNSTSQPPLREAPSAPPGGEPGGKYGPFSLLPWTRRDILWAVILGFGLVGGIAIVLLVGIKAYEYVARVELPAASGLVTLLAELAFLLPVWWFGLHKYHLSWASVGLRGFRFARGLGLGCSCIVFAFSFNVLWALFLSAFGLQAQPDLLPLFGGGISGLLLALLTGGIIAPIAEEVFFRGFVFAGLHRHVGLLAAMLLSAGLFALVHIAPTSWPPIFVYGALFALLYERTGSIWPGVFAHGLMNSMAFLALYLSTL